MLYFGTMLSAGLYGPEAYPLNLMAPAVGQLGGIGAFTSMDLALYLMEES